MNLSTVVLTISVSTDGNIQSGSQESRSCHALAFDQALGRCLVQEGNHVPCISDRSPLGKCPYAKKASREWNPFTGRFRFLLKLIDDFIEPRALSFVLRAVLSHEVCVVQ